MKDNIKIISKDDANNFSRYWNSFLENNQYSFSYTLENIKYFYSYVHTIIKDSSFIITQDNIAVGICFLPIEKIDEIYTISLNNYYIPAPLFINERIEKIIFNHIDLIAKQNNIQQIKIAIDPNLTFNKSNSYNNLKRYSFLETNSLNATVDLKLDKDELWRNLTKSYKSLINKYTKTTTDTLHIMTSENTDFSIQKEYWNLHCEIAGKNARGIELFEHQFELITQGYATLFYIKQDEEFISFSLFFHHNNFVTYVSSVTKDINPKPPISHYTLWNANLYFKNLGYELIQYGQPSGYSNFSGIDDIQDDKELAIAHFKRAMGTKTTTLYRGIKFYNKELLKNHLYNFIEQWKVSDKE